MGKALYRKYRSKDLSEIVGQDPIITALSNAIKTGRINHAYLFTGPRGVGKTSVARIIAHKINNIDYTSDQMPIDIIEIDAASNRRIDEIRDLREKVMIAPVSAKYKVYIIDEVHMLTREAFNALLKTLEEPPAHVIFILATTEAHKLPETIVSRTQKYNFKLASAADVFKLLKNIADKESINIDKDSLYLIAEHSGGSLRDAVSMLDQIRHQAEIIKPEIVRQTLGLPSKQAVVAIIDALSSKESPILLKNLKTAYQSGANANLLSRQILFEIKSLLTNGDLKIPQENALILLQDLLNASSSQQADIQLEIALLKCQLESNQKIKKSSLVLDHTIMPPLTVSKPVDCTHFVEIDEKASTGGNNMISEKLWLLVLKDINKTYSTLFGVLSVAKININNNEVTLSFNHQFHLNRASDKQNKKILLKALSKYGINDCVVIYRLNHIASKLVSKGFVSELDKIASVFGSAEVIK
jgi:DNA polymerase-3 subunit gamma/tau